MSDWADLE